MVIITNVRLREEVRLIETIIFKDVETETN